VTDRPDAERILSKSRPSCAIAVFLHATTLLK
jgi:hypothetical protein